MDTTTAFIQSDEDRAIVIVVNFGPLAGREATQAEVDRLARRLLRTASQVRVHAIRSHDMGPNTEAIVHQVVAEIDARSSQAGALRTACEAWAKDCAAERSVEPLGV
jgi:hypothetical protein